MTNTHQIRMMARTSDFFKQSNLLFDCRPCAINKSMSEDQQRPQLCIYGRRFLSHLIPCTYIQHNSRFPLKLFPRCGECSAAERNRAPLNGLCGVPALCSVTAASCFLGARSSCPSRTVCLRLVCGTESALYVTEFGGWIAVCSTEKQSAVY